MAKEVKMIMARDESQQLRLWACRGEGKGCRRNLHRTTSTPCDDCFGPLPEDWTLERVLKHMERGDA